MEVSAFPPTFQLEILESRNIELSLDIFVAALLCACGYAGFGQPASAA